MEKITAVVLAAGKGKRMLSVLPKVLHQLRSRPMVFHVLNQIKTVNQINQIIVVTGYQAKLVESTVTQEFKNIEFARQNELLGTADAVKLALPKVKNNHVLVLCADAPLITHQTLTGFINQHFAGKTGCSLLSAVVSGINELGVVVRDDHGQVKEIRERVDFAGVSLVNEVNSGIYLFHRQVLAECLTKIKKNSKTGEYFLTDTINLLYNQGIGIGSYFAPDSKEILGINNFLELAVAEQIMRERVLIKFISQGVKIIDPLTTFIDENVNIGKGTIVFPFTYIESDVTIGACCSLGPFLRIRSHSKIDADTVLGNFVEVNRTHTGKGIRAKHFCYLGDAQISDNVNIGAGTVIANYDGKKKHKTVIETGAFIGCDSVLVAPVKIGAKAVTGAGSVVTHNVQPNSVVVGVPARIMRCTPRKGKNNKEKNG